MTPDDIDIMARTLWGEARGEPLAGQIAVAWVIRNRADNSSWWGASIEGVCRKPFQFSCWNPNDPNRSKLIAVTTQDETFRACLMVTAAVLTRNFADPTGAANHYHTASIEPPWARGKQPTARIGNHVFFRL